VEEAKLLGDDREGDTVERDGEDRCEFGEDRCELAFGEERIELGEDRSEVGEDRSEFGEYLAGVVWFLLLIMGLGEEFCLSWGNFWVDCFWPDGDFGLTGYCLL